MQHRRGLLLRMRAAVLLGIAFLVPVGASTWSVSGSFEPDTAQDVLDQRMYVDPDVDPNGERVYFNAFPSDRTAGGFGGLGAFGVAVGADFNPNVGALRSRILPTAAMSMTAWLGVWKDCNRDGYIGHVETALVMYRSELLLDDSICPPNSRFNRFTWVTEFIYISPQAQNLTASLPRVLWDPDAAVWGDFGRPHLPAERFFDCAEPLPRGALDSTGALLAGVDCHLSYMMLRAIDGTHVNGVDLGFDGPGGPYHPEQDCDHPLNVHVGVYDNDPCRPDEPGLLGADADPMFTVWDCSAPGGGNIVSVPYPDDPVNDDEDWVGVGVPPLPGPAADTEGSPYAGVDAALAQCDRAPRDEGLGEDLFTPSYVGTNPVDPKRSTDFVFEYDMPPGSVGTTPQSMGIQGGRGAWNAEHTYHAPTYSANLVRASDLSGVAGQWFTFYARVGNLVLGSNARLPQASAGFYASEPCGDIEDGIRAGWDCDREQWWNEAQGGVEMPSGPRPGDAYHLRDTDCYDAAISDGSGVHAGGWLLSNDDPCPAMGPSILG